MSMCAVALNMSTCTVPHLHCVLKNMPVALNNQMEEREEKKLFANAHDPVVFYFHTVDFR